MFLSQLSYYLRVTALAMLFALSARPETTALPKAANVTDCQPCKFQPSARLPPYSFRFEIKSDPTAGRTITAIEVTRQGDTKPLQRLPVAGAMPVFEGESFFFGGQDINFDGNADLMLIIERGVANATALYWLFDAHSGLYSALGAFPVLRPEPGTHKLSAFRRNGEGGLLYEKREYSFEGSKLVLVRSETQQSTGTRGVYRRVLKERVNGQLKMIRSQTLQGKAAMPDDK